MHTTKTEKQINPAIHILTRRVALIGLMLTLLSACQSPQLFKQRFLQFGTIIDITLVSNDQEHALQLFDNIEQLLTKRHTEWHSWQDGALKQFNLALLKQYRIDPTKSITIPETLQLLIQQSGKYYALSEGRFNPAMGQLIDAWGFHQHSSANPALIDTLKKDVPGMHDLVITNNLARTLNPYLQLDFGAIAKGLAVKQISHILKQNNIKDFIINAGGDIYAEGRKQGQNWRVAIENPFNTDTKTASVIGSIQLMGPISIFTSGNYQRFYIDQNNRKRHHIIDPISGEPSSHISAVTVLHKDPVIADIAATTLMLTKISELKNIANKLKIKDFLAISDEQELFISPSMQQKLEWPEVLLFPTHLL